MRITLGDRLRVAREETGLTLSEVSFQTKIRENYLQALEDDQLDKFPSRTQGKGYLRIYADFLGLDEKPLFQAWEHPELLMPDEPPVVEEMIDSAGKPDQLMEELQVSLESDEELILPPSRDIPRGKKVFHGTPLPQTELIPSVDPPISLSEEIFQSIGKMLLEQRLKLKLTAADVEHFTSIKPHYQAALEEGRIDDLPSIPQAKGMLNNYASFLNLNLDEVMNKFADGLQTRRNESFAPHMVGKENSATFQHPTVKKVGWFKFITADLLVTTVLIIGLFVFIIWGAANISGFKKDSSEVEPPSISDVILEQTPQNQINDGEETLTVLSTTTPMENEQDGQSQQDLKPSSAVSAATPLSGLPIQVYIIARQRAYLLVVVDGKTVFNGRTVPGNGYEYSGYSTIALTTGNAAGLEIYHNLVPLGDFGKVGEIKSIIFSVEDGIITPTPEPLPTQLDLATKTPTPEPTLPSPTLSPTPTPTPTVTPLIP